jgi:predicted amidohydrolase
MRTKRVQFNIIRHKHHFQAKLLKSGYQFKEHGREFEIYAKLLLFNDNIKSRAVDRGPPSQGITDSGGQSAGIQATNGPQYN